MAVLVASFVLSGLVRPETFSQFFSGFEFYDEEHYLALAREGMPSTGSAFHPLYAWLIAAVGELVPKGLLPKELHLIAVARLLSAVLFMASLIAMARLLTRVVSWPTAALVTLLFGINPFSIFHVLAYTESLYGFLGILLMTGLLDWLQPPASSSSSFTRVGAALTIVMSAGLMALARPSYFIVFAIVVGFMGIYGLQFLTSKPSAGSQRSETKGQHRRFNLALGLLVLATGGFTAGYFMYLDQVTGSPFASLEAQKNFDRSFGFYWQHFIKPATLNGSDNIFVWEIQAFWLPMFMAALFALYRPWRDWLDGKGAGFYVFWFATFFTGAHIAANVFTHPRFYSLGRHVLAQPFFFVALAFAIEALQRHNGSPSTKARSKVSSKALRYFVWFYLFASFVYLAMFWGRFAKGSWIG